MSHAPYTLFFDDTLPINQRRQEIAATIRDHPVTILCGETGSGKTTQLPKICLSLGRGEERMIGHTQPRRIAARAVANRIAEELETTLGSVVGYKIRFSNRSHKQSRIKLMTDGILLAEIQSDPLLRHYDTLIIDEAHERSLNIDFLLGYLKQLLPRRPDLKLIITSATIDPERFSRHFNDAPILNVSGRTWPVEVRYRPIEEEESEEKSGGRSRRQEQSRPLQQAVLAAVEELGREGQGDILIFFSGEREINEMRDHLQGAGLRQTEVLPLYSRLSSKEQNRIFASHPGRRIILATNVAETSLTVPGIRYVIDIGTARISRYSHRTGIQRLPIEPISQAAANQRKGRCGRVANGICIRLYSEEAFNSRPLFTDPEILRTHLAPVILQMSHLGLGRPESFPFIDPPDLSLIRDGLRTLRELGALKRPEEGLTALGRKLARFPLDPQIARMLLAAEREGSLQEIQIIAAALSIQDPRERPQQARQQADQRHQPFTDESSDFLFFLNLWNFYQEQRTALSGNQLRKLCKNHFLSWMRMREWQEVHSQLQQVCRELKLQENDQPADYGMIHRALLAGLLSHIATASSEKHRYDGARGVQLRIWPGSTQFKGNPKWIVAAEKVETTQLYARTIARIEPLWLERVGSHLLKRSYAEPHWEKRRGQVAAYETVTLYGLPIISRRKTNYGPIDPKESRTLFIRSGLVEGEVRTAGGFLRHNRREIEKIESLEAKSRRRDILADDETLFQFYDQHIPQRIYSTPAFEKWRKKVEQENPRLLYLSAERLMQHDAESVQDPHLFPDQITLGRTRLPLSYLFEPGSDEDGVTLKLPQELLPQLDPEPFEWLVPGLFRERLIAMLRALPKRWRRNFVPVPEFADALLPTLDPGRGPLRQQLSQRLRQMTGVTLPEELWEEATPPDHLQFRFVVIDAAGKPIDHGRNLRALQQRGNRLDGARPTRGQNSASVAPPPRHPLEQQDLQHWSIGSLPESVEVERHAIGITLYPAVVHQREPARIDLQLLHTPEEAEAASRKGITALFLLQYRRKIEAITTQAIDGDRLCLHYLTLGRCRELREDLLTVTARELLFGDNTVLPRTAQQYEQRCGGALSALESRLRQNGALLSEILQRHHRLQKQLKGNLSPALLKSYSAIRSHLDTLVYPHFICHTPTPWLPELPRYLQAIEIRLERLLRNPSADQQRARQLEPYWNPIQQRLTENSAYRREEYRWMVEEYRVSLFAQELGTRVPVSPERLKKMWRRGVG